MVLRVFVVSFGTWFWWRRRGSNPRPQVRCSRLYMFILSISLTQCYPTDRENKERFW